jgi:hypothetical protein
MQQRKSIQDMNGALRQRDQSLVHQKKLHEDEIARARQKEQVLMRRVEHLQRSWRSAEGKLEVSAADTQDEAGRRPVREIAPRKAAKAVVVGPTAAETLAERLRRRRTEQARSKGTTDAGGLQGQPEATLKSVEAQAQAELAAWKKKETEKTRTGQGNDAARDANQGVESGPDANDPGAARRPPAQKGDTIEIPDIDDQRGRDSNGRGGGLFRDRPWISLKEECHGIPERQRRREPGARTGGR